MDREENPIGRIFKLKEKYSGNPLRGYPEYLMPYKLSSNLSGVWKCYVLQSSKEHYIISSDLFQMYKVIQ